MNLRINTYYALELGYVSKFEYHCPLRDGLNLSDFSINKGDVLGALMLCFEQIKMRKGSSTLGFCP